MTRSIGIVVYCELVLGRLAEARAHADNALALNPAHALAIAVRAKI